MSDIAQMIRELAGNRNQDTVKLLQCNVDNVDMAARTCEVSTLSGDTTLTFTASLMAAVGDGDLKEPALNSTVYVVMSKYILPFVVCYSDIVNYVFMGGEFGGLVKVIELTEKLNTVENTVNEIINKLNTLTLPVSGATAGPPTGPPMANIAITLQKDIENEFITHGAPDTE